MLEVLTASEAPSHDLHTPCGGGGTVWDGAVETVKELPCNQYTPVGTVPLPLSCRRLTSHALPVTEWSGGSGTIVERARVSHWKGWEVRL